MSRGTFLSLFIIFNISLIFIKIYQHNSIIKMIYEKQKIEKEKNKLLLRKDHILIHLATLKNSSYIEKKATENNLRKLNISQLRLLSLKSNKKAEEK